MKQPSLVWARGPYPVMVCLGAATAMAGRDRPQPPTLHPFESLFTQTGRPHEDGFICSSCPESATHLWLWHTGLLFSLQGQDSKSGHKLKKNQRWKEKAQPRKLLLL